MMHISKLTSEPSKLKIMASSDDFSAEQKAILDEIFNALSAAKPQSSALFAKDTAGAVGWKKSLGVAIINANLTRRQIEVGIMAALKDPSDFFPSVGRFISLCSDITDEQFDAYYQQSVRRDWTDTIAFHAYTLVDTYRFRHLSEDAAKDEYRQALKKAFKQVKEGVVVEIPPKDQKQIESLPASKETAKKHLDELMKMMGMNL